MPAAPFTAANVRTWVGEVVPESAARFTVGDKVLDEDVIYVHGLNGHFTLARDDWEGDRAALEAKLRAWATLAV